MTILCPRVGRNRIRPTNDPERGEYVQNRIKHSCARKWMTQIHGVRFLLKTSVGRMQYAPTRGRKWYAQDCGVRDWGRKRYAQGGGIRDRGRKWYVRGHIYPIRFIIPPLRYGK